ncbi:MAG: DUF362 domain-containing protein, partial [Gemmataceae bacterium]
QEICEKALAWIQQCDSGDGTFRLEKGRREAAWPTALVLFTLAEWAAPDESLQRIARALLALRGRPADTRGDEEINDIDGLLIGWSWAENTFSWVEPTSWACISLQKVGQGQHPRVIEGKKLLLNRILDTGGLNYGNRRVLRVTLEPIPTPTALALMALQDEPANELIEKSRGYLSREAEASDDVEHLAWSILALDALDHERTSGAEIARLQNRLRQAIEARRKMPYLNEAPTRLALTALALQVPGRNPFRREDGSRNQTDSLTPGVLSSPRTNLGDRVRTYMRGLAIKGVTHLKPLESRSVVHIGTASDYNVDLGSILSRQYEHFRDKVPLRGRRVVIKPNLVEYHRNKVINTNPYVIAGVIELCRREGAAEVIVAEGPGHWRNVEYLVKASGLGEVLRHFKTSFIDLNHDEPTRLLNLGRLTGLDQLYLARTVAEAEVLISLPKLKTHHWAGVTLSMKNLFGTMPGIFYGWPKNELHWRGIDNSIVDIAMTRTPDLAIVDGIVGMEGDGPLNGTPKQMGVLVMGTDLVAVDATCCRLMQLDPGKINYLMLANKKKLGHISEASIEQRGERIDARKKPFDTIDAFKNLWVGRTA